MRHVLWIGGAPGAGKTTVARRLARRHGLRWYNADAHTWEHRDRALAAGDPAALRWEAMTPHERWVETPPAEMVDLSLTFDRGRMIVADLRRLPVSPLIVAEGSTVLPEVVEWRVADRSRAVWLVPTPELQRARLGGAPNVVELWLLVGAELERRVRATGVPALAVDGTLGRDETLATVEELFAGALAEGPRAKSADERRALLRYANEAVVAQALGYLARPWAEGEPETFVRSFLCECDDPECDEQVALPVAGFPHGGRLLAPGHASR
jgi:hypothetical protein